LILSINGETEARRGTFQTVWGSKSTDLRDGDAAMAWKISSIDPATNLSQ
jgi:hypothetical protein